MVHRRSWSIFAVTLALTLAVLAATLSGGTAPVLARVAFNEDAPAGHPLGEATTTPEPPVLQEPFPTLPPIVSPPTDPVVPPPLRAPTAGTTITHGVQICTAGDTCIFLSDADAQVLIRALQAEPGYPLGEPEEPE